MHVVRFSNGRFGIRRWSWDPLMALFTLCPYEFLTGWYCGSLKDIERDRRCAEGRGWSSKGWIDQDDTFETQELAEAALKQYKINLENGKKLLIAKTFNCGERV